MTPLVLSLASLSWGRKEDVILTETKVIKSKDIGFARCFKTVS